MQRNIKMRHGLSTSIKKCCLFLKYVVLTSKIVPTSQRRLHCSPTFLRSKKKKGKQRNKEGVSRQKPLILFHQGENVTILAIQERLEFKIISMAPPLSNLFRRPFTC